MNYAEFSRVLVNSFGTMYEEFVENKEVTEEVIKAVKESSADGTKLKEQIEGLVKKRLNSSVNDATSEAVDKIFDGESKAFESLMELIRDDTSNTVGSYMDKIVKILDNRFEIKVIELVHDAYKKATSLSEELLEYDKDQRMVDVKKRIGKLISERHKYGFDFTDGNKRFIQKTLKGLSEIERRNKIMSSMGVRSSKEALVKDLQKEGSNLNMFKYSWHSSMKWIHVQVFEKFRKKQLEYLEKEAERLKKQTGDTNRVIGPNGGVLGLFNKALSMAMLPVVTTLQQVVKHRKTIAKFSKAIVSGIMKAASIGVKAIKTAIGLGITTVKTAVGLVSTAIQSPFKVVEKMHNLLNTPFTKTLVKFLSGPEGAVFLATVGAFFKVFVFDYILEKIDPATKMANEFVDILKSENTELKGRMTVIVNNSWRERLGGKKDWKIQEDEKTINEFRSQKEYFYGLFKSGKGKDDIGTRIAHYIMSTEYGFMVGVLQVNMWMKKTYENFFPFKEQEKMTAAQRALVSEQSNFYGGELWKDTVKSLIGVYSEVAVHWMKEIVGDFDIG